VRFVVHSSAVFQTCAVVKSVSVTPKGLNPSGEVVDGFLKLSAPHVPIIEHSIDNQGFTYGAIAIHGRSIQVRSTFDHDESHDDRHMYLAILSFGWTDDIPQVPGNPLVGLILVSTGNSTYRRVGLSPFVVIQAALTELSMQIPLDGNLGSKERLMKNLMSGLSTQELTVM
jgi:hypothetical protein